MNVFAKIYEIPSMIFQDIKETKRTDKRPHGRSDGRMDNLKTVYPPTNTVCGGYKEAETQFVGGIKKHKHSLRGVLRSINTVCGGYKEA